MSQDIKIPEGTAEIILGVYGYHDEGYDSCAGIKLIAITSELTTGGWYKSTTETFWESSLLDTHPDEYEYNYQTWREELIEVFEELGLDITEVKNFDEDCIYDWEFEHVYNT